ncbi:MAG TPA: FHA domain-containing protein [Kofleriaceae bacterium]|nr:FHA domain-containing protein [Kofleriaceae bacterium]
MSFWKRMLSADYRAAVAAEASGNVEAAAERYGLAGDRAGAVRMHVARAERANDRITAITALRDALHWAGDEPDLRRQAARSLGRALHAQAEAEGVATARDRERLREAATLLAIGGDHKLAGEAFEKLGDLASAAVAYGAGGLVDKVEETLAKDEDKARADRELRDAFAAYETSARLGRRDDARAELAKCAQLAPSSAEYRRLLDELDAKLITGARVELKRRHGRAVIACGAKTITLGRDPLADLPLRSGGASRHHAEIAALGAGSFVLRDLGSRNGTKLGGLPLAGAVPLAGEGRFALGDDCMIDFDVRGTTLHLRIEAGLDRGAELVAAADGEAIDLSRAQLACALEITRGRPWLGRGGAREIKWNGESVAGARVQLVRGDLLVVDGEEIDVG